MLAEHILQMIPGENKDKWVVTFWDPESLKVSLSSHLVELELLFL